MSLGVGDTLEEIHDMKIQHMGGRGLLGERLLFYSTGAFLFTPALGIVLVVGDIWGRA